MKRTAEFSDRMGLPNARASIQPIFVLTLGVIALSGTYFFPTPQSQLVLWAIVGGCFAAAAVLAGRLMRYRWRVRGDLDAARRLMEHDPAPCFCTDETGAILVANAAAERRFGDRTGQAMARAISGLLPNAAAVVFRHDSTLEKRAVAHETVHTPRGPVRVTAYRLVRGLFWRIDDYGTAANQSGEGISLPMMMVSPNDTILSMNAAMRSVLGRRTTGLDEVFPDLPLVSGRRSRMLAQEGPIEVIPVVVTSQDGRREVYAVPGLAEPPAASIAARAFEALPVALLHIGNDCTVLASNRHAQTLLGIEADATGRLSRFVEGLGRPVNDWVLDTLAERVPNRSEVVRARRRAEECFLKITLSRITDGTGPSLLAVLHDATELKTLEQQFVQSQKMQAIGELAGGIAHDFNNLLTAISGHCDLLMLRRDPGDPDYADMAQIHQNTNRAAALVGQLLAFSRKQTLEPEILDLRESIADLTHLLNRLVGERVTLSLSHDRALKAIRADRRHLDQVVMNLVVNARDAMPDGGEIRIETRLLHLTDPLHRDQAEVPPGRYVTLRVRDQGRGIARDKLDRIFEPFFTTKTAGEGTGLGLSMAYGIVKQSGGYIFVDSTVGVGTSFKIYFPVYDVSASEAALAATQDHGQSRTRPGATGPADAGAVILLVEDEAPVRAFATRALRLRGYTVIEAQSAEEALERLSDRALHVDLFVTDVVMPGMDGPTWVRQALQDRPDTRVVFVSGYAEEAIEDGKIEIPNSVFLPKPFSLSDLTETVANQLG